MKYSLIIPAWNEEAYLPACLAAAHEAMAACAFDGELVVVDNNSTDATAEIAAEAGARVVFEPINQIARARNAGAQQAAGDALVFVDADSRISAQLLQAALQNLQGGDVVGGGAEIVFDTPVRWVAQQSVNAWNRLSRSARLAAGCFVYCRRDAFDAVGGFNVKAYAGEELFLSRGLKRWGRKNNMHFEVIAKPPMVTSSRKLDWYSPWQLTKQVLMVLVPGAMFSKSFCRTWYDDQQTRR